MRALSILVCTALGALTVATAAPAHADDSRIQSAPQVHVTVDRALIARHRALGRLGEPTVTTNPAIIARHRALGRLPDLSASSTSRNAPAGPSTSSFPWTETGFGFAATALLALIGVGVMRSGRVRMRRSGI